MVVGASHESARPNFGRVLDTATPATIQPGRKLTYCSVVDLRAETIDLGDNLRYVGGIIQDLFIGPHLAFFFRVGGVDPRMNSGEGRQSRSVSLTSLHLWEEGDK